MVRSDNTIRFATTPDNTRLAWTVSGDGPPLVKAANWLSHLEYDRQSLVWGHWVGFLSRHFRYYRYDERGLGLSDRRVENLGVDTWVPDLEVVVEAAQPEKPFALLGISQGAGMAITYAARYPDHVSQLVIYGGYLRGWARRSEEERRTRSAMAELAEVGWGKPDTIFRRLYTSMFLPEGTEDQLRWFDELCTKSTSPDIAAHMMKTQGHADFSDVLGKVTVPALVLHAREDKVIPYSQGMDIAAGIEGSEFVMLDSKNHILLQDEPAWERFCEAVLDFTGRPAGEEDPVFGTLSSRERDVLAKVTEGLANPDIAGRLFISEKTVKNHITKIFEKLGVRTRSQAIVMARDKGFRGD
jgi:pimeloyl-ACP methyl ester carboxylesterase/DNA-binding CsgD family transcriptional regulator